MTLKPNSHSRKLLLCCWWNTRGMLYWELLSQDVTVTASIYIHQLEKLAQATWENCRDVRIFTFSKIARDLMWQERLSTDYRRWAGRRFPIHCIPLTLPLPTTTCSVLLNIYYRRNRSRSMKTSNWLSLTFSTPSCPSSGSRESAISPFVGLMLLITLVIISLIEPKYK